MPINGMADHYYPYEEAIKPMADLGFFGTVIPEAYDGVDMGWLAAMIVTEEIARASSSLRVQINMQTLGTALYHPDLWQRGSEAEIHSQTGQRRICWGPLPLPNRMPGSDVMAITSTARDMGDHWLLNGSKTWISNAAFADAIIYYAYTDRDAGSRGPFRLCRRTQKL